MGPQICSFTVSLVLVALSQMGCAGSDENVFEKDAGATADKDIGEAFDDIGVHDAAHAVDDIASAGEAGGDTKAEVHDATPLDCPRGPGCSCEENADCDNTMCIDTPAGRKCAVNCVDKCPDDFVCGQAPGNDTVNICLPLHLSLCAPCTTSKDCQVYKNGSVCVAYSGELGSFCGSNCNEASDCPAGYECKKATSAEDTDVKQCVLTGAGTSLGECACSIWATSNAMSTTCSSSEVVDGKSVVCKGTRACGTGGLSACSAKPTDEFCDGEDNNCDGEIDNLVCDDNKACTDDNCGDNGECVHATKQDGLPCNDGDACTDKDACTAGTCQGAPKKCDDNNPCTDDTCDKGGCNNAPNTSPCDDGDACTLGDKCTAEQGVGICKAGLVKMCEDGNTCLGEACNGATGQCDKKPAKDGQTCDDGDPCTLTSGCKGGACASSAKKSCADANPCTQDDQCDASGNCVFPPAAASCTDGIGCTEDVCKGGKCTSAPSHTSCDDGNNCSADTCDTAMGCSSTSTAMSCDDGNACTVGDTCGDMDGKAACLPGAATECDDANICTADSCVPTQGCSYKPLDGSQPCYAGLAHTKGVGRCKPGTATCSKGVLGKCVAEVLPADKEACDGHDDDCDGVTDEGCKAAGMKVRAGWVHVDDIAGTGEDAKRVQLRGSFEPLGTAISDKHAARFGFFAWLFGEGK